jgi:hypothetical protein
MPGAELLLSYAGTGPHRLSIQEGERMETQAPNIFRRCAEAIESNALIERESRRDKEFHFQNWFRDRLFETGLNFEPSGRNSFPDFRLVQFTEGYEVKGLAYPGRQATFDSNSQVPSGLHNGRTIYYVFGRYPRHPDGDTYPVIDLVIAHGDFLNADHAYFHSNKSVKGFGTYGDLSIRDRKMYVVPTPFDLAQGLAHQLTLILPSDIGPDYHLGLVEVGHLVRQEADHLVVAYTFDLRTGSLETDTSPNPNAGREHHFRAWRLAQAGAADVVMVRNP